VTDARVPKTYAVPDGDLPHLTPLKATDKPVDARGAWTGRRRARVVVGRAYLTLLGREASEAELAAAEDCAFNLPAVVDRIVHSSEHARFAMDPLARTGRRSPAARSRARC
jgi:hypothetical protein